MKAFMRTLIHIFLPHFVEIRKAEVTKVQTGAYIMKKVSIMPFLGGFWSDLAKNFI